LEKRCTPSTTGIGQSRGALHDFVATQSLFQAANVDGADGCSGALAMLEDAMPNLPSQMLSALLLAVAALSGLGAAAPASASPKPPEHVVETWPKLSSHPLVGKILRTRDGRVLDGIALAKTRKPQAILDALSPKGVHFVLLGEIHDNPEHHRFRAGLIDGLTDRTRFGRNAHPPVITEHIRAEQAQALERFRTQQEQSDPPPSADDLFRLLDWDKSGWPAAAMFRPLYGAVLEARLRLVAGDASRDKVRRISREGLSALEPAEMTKLSLEQGFAPPLAAALAADLVASHCGMIPESATLGMADAQRYRDAVMATTMLNELSPLGSTILLAGNGHVRTDRGVPWHLRRLAPDRSILAVMLIEVENGKTDPAAHVPRDPGGRPAVDAIVFTPRAEREDPCERMRAAMQKKG
jgi:uncharacterized iron-regulated protein